MEGVVVQMSPEKTKEYEEALWQRAEEFSVIRRALQQELEKLDKLFIERPLSSLNLYEKEKRGHEEKRYWEIKAEIEKIIAEENKLEDVILRLTANSITENEITHMLPEQNEEQRALSKRKKRILEEKQRLGIDPRGVMNEMYGEFGSEKMHLTTGRHVHAVKNLGSVDPLFAAAEFYYRTTDSHGGKVDYGKKSDSYVSPSGKRIRKK